VNIPSPRTQPLVGHLGRWGTDPLALLTEGATLGPVFSLRLWRKAIVGSSPQWNRFLLGDLDTFRSRGSLSGLSPYLAGGIVRSDLPEHQAQRARLNPGFHRRSIAAMTSALQTVVAQNLPTGQFDTVAWSAELTQELLAVAFFGGTFPRDLLRDFVEPLDTPPPGPFLRHPRLFRRMTREITAALIHAEDNSLAATFATMDDGVEQARVALGAAYDTTAHTLAWLLWHLADRPALDTPTDVADIVSETLRLYPSGWLGSRVSVRDTEFDGIEIPAKTLLFYSPFLTHRDGQLWADPLTFRPERFRDPRPAWGYLPFSAGQRTCLGASLATLILRTVAEALTGQLTRVTTQQTLRAGLTLAPAGPILVRRSESLRRSEEVLRKTVSVEGVVAV
jgi:cytochrome P450